jgi:phosphatidate cytidylyltransferase
MAPPAEARPGLSNLHLRLISAAILLPAVVAAIYLGHPWFTLVLTLFAAAAAWECTTVAANERPAGGTTPVPQRPSGIWLLRALLSALLVAVFVLLVGFDPDAQQVSIAFLALGGLWLAVTLISRHWRRTLWNLPGVLYVAVAAGTLVVVRQEPDWGLASLLWIIALVVAADTGGYIAGRSIGGPKLAPRISPNKTWAGLGGAVLGAALVGLITAFMLNHTNVWALAAASAFLGVIEQVGDLVESAFKRHFGVKDTSHIIPGHGGVLDRVDGLLAVAVAVLVINEWAGGSMLAWS